jgi:hypothetical protein
MCYLCNKNISLDNASNQHESKHYKQILFEWKRNEKLSVVLPKLVFSSFFCIIPDHRHVTWLELASNGDCRNAGASG